MKLDEALQAVSSFDKSLAASYAQTIVKMLQQQYSCGEHGDDEL